MSNLLKFPNRRRIREAAALWVVRLDRTLSDQEARELGLWLAESRLHRESLLEAARCWDDVEVLASLSKLFPLKELKPAPRRVGWMHLTALAAGVGLVVAFWPRPQTMPLGPPAGLPVTTGSADTAAAQTYQTAVGQQSLVMLADGSQIQLNTDSLIEVNYSPTGRRVHLVRGEANFEVAKDAARPFDVRAGSHIVRAVGTAFDVRVSGIASMEVTVSKGRIRVLENTAPATALADPASAPGAGSATAVAGQLVTVTSDGSPRVRMLDRTEESDRTAWQRGMLVFRGTPLRDVLREFSRYSNQKIIPNDDSIGDISVGGIFSTADVEGLLMELRTNFGLKTRRVGDVVTIARKDDLDEGHGL